TDKLAPNRSSEIRSSTKKELAATLLVSVPLIETSVKIRTGPPKEAENDLNAETWSGVIPFKLIAKSPIAGDEYSKNSKTPESVEQILKNYN
ncbi:MAG: pyridoxamine 5'-phosphate oxidase family protein, partial [Candidatus Nanopelagicales bacterium]